jgi:type I restriction enzyme M protein
LISAYKHIRKHNSSNFKPEKEKAEEKLPEGETIAETVLAEKTYRGDKLTPSERGKLMNNFVGYDISPDMVKLSLVNMYLHGFSDPKIYEYDTLTSEKHWGEQFDVIMANPPFMSPKGGIRPHKRFSVQASRSEVLFVNYILEHLALKGRAGIIVPEGIIFKTENAYKQLREMLIEDGLFAVVSLPPGVFNPYSSVKTSILLFDNELAKKSDKILFLKIENDGFDLGAQRRKIEKNDLPEALDILDAWKQGKKKESDIALWVKKEKIAESGDYNLTGERYKETEVRKNQKWPLVELKEVAKVDWGNTELTKKSYVENGEFLGVSAAGADGRMDHFEHEIGVTVLSAIGANCGRVFYPTEKFTAIKNTITFTLDRKKLEPKYLFYIMKDNTLPKRGGGQPFMSKGDVEKYQIPLPPLEVQKEIVEQIEVKQSAINHAKEIIKNLERERRYFGQELRKLEDVEWVELGKVCKTTSGGTPLKSKKEFYENGTIPWLTSGEVNQGFIYESKQKITELGLKKSSAKMFPKNTVLVAMYGATAGKVGLLKFESSTNQAVCGILPSDNFLSDFLYMYLKTQTDEMVRLSGGGAQPNISQTIIKKLRIPLPPLEIQKQLVAEAEKEEEIIIANRRLIEIMEEKISAVLEEI